jgi:hypothetical protein
VSSAPLWGCPNTLALLEYGWQKAAVNRTHSKRWREVRMTSVQCNLDRIARRC